MAVVDQPADQQGLGVSAVTAAQDSPALVARTHRQLHQDSEAVVPHSSEQY